MALPTSMYCGSPSDFQSIGSRFSIPRQDETTNPEQDSNPYAVPAHWSPADITDYLLTAEEKPRSIRRRLTFVQAICDAADAVIENADSTSVHKRVAAIQKARALHFRAGWGYEDSDQQLRDYVPVLKSLAEQLQSKQLLREVAFLEMETDLIDFNSQSPGEVNAILGRAHDYLVTQDLTDRHLRMASNIVRVINQLDSDDDEQKQQLGQQRELLFTKFGKLFQESKEIRLARYGKNLANMRSDAKSLVGSVISIEGVTLAKTRYSSADDRGQIVLVDFWATWCEPCRKGLPELKTLQENYGGDRFSIVGINLDKELDELREYADEHQLNWPNIIDADAERIANAYSVVTIPTFILLDTHGKALFVSNRIADVKPAVERALADLEKQGHVKPTK